MAMYKELVLRDLQQVVIHMQLYGQSDMGCSTTYGSYTWQLAVQHGSWQYNMAAGSTTWQLAVQHGSW